MRDSNAQATSTGIYVEAKPMAKLPPKIEGKHRWIATGAWILSDEHIANAFDADADKYLDHENMMHIGFGCWDCEQPLGDRPGMITATSTCKARPPYVD